MGGLEIGGSLVFLMGFSFLASVTLLVLSSLLLLIFITLLFFAGFVFVGAMTGFAVAGAMALTGMSTLGWIFQELGGTGLLGFGGVAERLKEQFSIGNGAFSKRTNIWERKRTEGKGARRGKNISEGQYGHFTVLLNRTKTNKEHKWGQNRKFTVPNEQLKNSDSELSFRANLALLCCENNRCQICCERNQL